MFVVDFYRCNSDHTYGNKTKHAFHRTKTLSRRKAGRLHHARLTKIMLDANADGGEGENVGFIVVGETIAMKRIQMAYRATAKK